MRLYNEIFLDRPGPFDSSGIGIYQSWNTTLGMANCGGIIMHCICGVDKPESEMVPWWDLIFICRDCAERFKHQSELNAFQMLMEVRREQNSRRA